ncbi:MAG: sigma-54-dependent transcriptional regulator [Nannocystaceae bacterium]|nr:sigma-54 dependent transcriptional regulator [bacterium]
MAAHPTAKPMSKRSSKRVQILVVDDESSARSGLVELLREEGYEVRGAADAFKALGMVEAGVPDLLITDVHMPGMDGTSLMAKVQEAHPEVGVIVMTAYSTVERAVAAMQQGADDYLTKPIRFDELLLVVDRLLAHRETARELEEYRRASDAKSPALGWVGQSKASRNVLDLIRQVADSPASVLLTGESGTGKELAARALHDASPRRTGPFVPVHCAALAEGVLESELFGHEKGAFTGADSTRDGRFARANGGTLFLDEVGEIPLSVQVKLLRVLQERTYERVGGDRAIEVDVRVVAATHRDLLADVKEGRFREDLFYRLNVINVRLPTLRERADDIPLLAMHFLAQHASRARKQIRSISERSLDALRAYDWPGNVRQLENCIEHAVALCNDFEVDVRHLPREVLGSGRALDELPIVPGSSMAEVERYVILKTLESVGGSTSKAAKILGVSPRTIQYRMNQYRDEDPEQVALILARKKTRKRV